MGFFEILWFIIKICAAIGVIWLILILITAMIDD